MRPHGTVTFALPRIVVDSFPVYTGFVFVLAMLFGGGARQGLLSDVVVQLAALPLLGWALFRLAPARLSPSGRWGVVILCAILALPLGQLIPLPPGLWSSLNGRHEIASAYQAAGMALPWLPLSLDPAATWRGLLALIPAAAIFLAMLSLDKQAHRNVVLLAVVFAVASLPLDLLQMMGGTDSPLRFYTITNPDRAVGFFANANHHAAFLYCAIPIAVAWAIVFMANHRWGRTIGMPALLAVAIAAIISLALTHSRAGLALGFVAGLCCLALIWRDRHSRSRRKLVLYGLGANLIGLLIAFQFGFAALATKLENTDTIEDIRWPVAVVTSQAALANLPFGSGFGSFIPVYEMYAPRTMLRSYYVNHAHNDWLELWLTGGVPALAIVLVFFAWFVRASLSAWRRHPPDTMDVTFARAASIAIALLLLHSMVDYPLRSTAISVLFAAACTFLIPARRNGRHDRDAHAREPVPHAGALTGPI